MTKIYHAKHILLEEEEDLSYVKNQLETGRSFEELAREFSECESAIRGGDLGRFQSGTMDASFERALYQMRPGEIRFGIKTKYGFHIVKLICKTS